MEKSNNKKNSKYFESHGFTPVDESFLTQIVNDSMKDIINSDDQSNIQITDDKTNITTNSLQLQKDSNDIELDDNVELNNSDNLNNIELNNSDNSNIVEDNVIIIQPTLTKQSNTDMIESKNKSTSHKEDTSNQNIDNVTASFSPVMAVMGIGGGGCNSIQTMLKDQETFESVKFIVANTDNQVLKYFPKDIVIQLGPNCTRGLGAGADPEVGKLAAEESEEEIRRALKGVDMIFIASGMGGGTGTGAAPRVADIAKKMGILTVAVVTIPFSFEGLKRNNIAQKGVIELKEKADCVVIVPNDKLLNIINDRTPLSDAFKMADDVLYNAVKCVVELIMKPGLINLDFADVRTVMSNMRTAFLSIGKASGEDRALRAAEIAINNPLSNVSLHGATSLLINISGGEDLTLYEVNIVVAKVLEERGTNTVDAITLVGATYNAKMTGTGEISVYIIATGIYDEHDQSKTTDNKNEANKNLDNLNMKSKIGLNSEKIDINNADKTFTDKNSFNKNLNFTSNDKNNYLNNDAKNLSNKNTIFGSKGIDNKFNFTSNENLENSNKNQNIDNNLRKYQPVGNYDNSYNKNLDTRVNKNITNNFGENYKLDNENQQQKNKFQFPTNNIQTTDLSSVLDRKNNAIDHNFTSNQSFQANHEFQNYEMENDLNYKNPSSQKLNDLNKVQDKPLFLKYRNQLNKDN